MKVLHVINSLNPGGAEKVLVDILLYNESSDIDMDILILNDSQKVLLDRLRESFRGSIYTSNVKGYYNLLQFFEIKKYLKPYYNIIHVHLFPSLYWVAIIKFVFGLNIPLIFTEHSTSNRRIESPFYRILDRFIYKRYEKIIAITPQVKEVLENKLGILPSKIEVIYNGIDINRYAFSKSYGEISTFNSEDIILIQISRFAEAKDQKTLIYALNDLPNEYKLLLVGDGETKVFCENLVQDLQLQDRVQFLAVRSDIPELLKTADIVIQSSHWEGFGLAALEGMASGKPVIGSNVPGLREIILDYGLLFEKSDHKDLVRKIQYLEDESNYQKIKSQCINRAKDFTISTSINKLTNVYNSIYS